MPLRELADYFNRENLKRYGALRGIDTPLVSLGDAGVAGHFADITLDSAFQPIFHADSLHPAGFEALLRPSRRQQSLSPASVFLLPANAAEVVYLDGLCRTLHALNFLLQSREDDGWLALNIHPRHLTSVLSEHGLVFESILQQCGLSPRRVVLEIGIAAQHLATFVARARRHRYWRHRRRHAVQRQPRAGGSWGGLSARRCAGIGGSAVDSQRRCAGAKPQRGAVGWVERMRNPPRPGHCSLPQAWRNYPSEGW